ncbi:MAG TPA: L,D-transpeptidase [Salinarimonas sp.]|nr:L,D-transpeptidase [Salinarimonas sp.]
MSRPLLLSLLLAGAATGAAAQVAVNEPPVTGSTQRAALGGYGGGFIELLVTGRDPTPAARAYNAPRVPAVVAPVRLPPRVAALPEDPGPHRMLREVEPQFRRQTVAYDGPHAPGTIVVDTPNRFLFLVQPGGKALRYGIGVGRPGFEWAGMKSVTMKREWPDWRPPDQMLKRRPDLPRHMPGGPDNPLGARALYLGSSLYRIHGTNEPWTIGQAVSSGCIRMTNDDVVDLYNRTRVGARVLVI